MEKFVFIKRYAHDSTFMNVLVMILLIILQQAALELERFIEASIETLEAPIQAALAPKHWRSKGERSWVARELERREAATKDFGTLCEELLESETRFDS
jgi:hypothetical protein